MLFKETFFNFNCFYSFTNSFTNSFFNNFRLRSYKRNKRITLKLEAPSKKAPESNHRSAVNQKYAVFIRKMNGRIYNTVFTISYQEVREKAII